jgi:hypothetical protein
MRSTTTPGAERRDGTTNPLQSLVGEIQSAFALMEHAEDEICRAMKRHPTHADRIWHSFSLLPPTLGRLHTEIVYRAHCRELLNRVAIGEDTRTATAAECCVALMETSLAVPLSTTAMGLYMRLWTYAKLPDLGFRDRDPREHYEALKGSQIDDHERWLRHKLRQDWRTQPADIPHVRMCPHSQHAQQQASTSR